MPFFEQNIIFLIGGAIAVFLFLWVAWLHLRLRTLFRGSDAQNLESIIRENKTHISQLDQSALEAHKDITALQNELTNSKRHIGIVRFNAFNKAGGDQSFAFAVLDDKKNGIVVSSFHNRDTSRIYAKPITNGESSYQLSEEEREAIRRALSPQNQE